MNKERFKRVWSRIHYVWVRLGVFALIAMPVAAFFTFRAQGLPGDTWQPTPTVSVDRGESFLKFGALPLPAAAKQVLVIPGCPVEAEAYAPLARNLAGRGFTTLIVRVPFRCAPLPTHAETLHERVATLIGSCRECEWALIGHSRGAAHALDLVQRMPDRIARLVLLGSTHPREKDFSRLRLPVMKVSGTRDGVAPLEASESNRQLLPSSVRWEVVDGGNHSQFAYYGFQLFDRRAAISREEQHRQVVNAIVSFVEQDR